MVRFDPGGPQLGAGPTYSTGQSWRSGDLDAVDPIRIGEAIIGLVTAAVIDRHDPITEGGDGG